MFTVSQAAIDAVIRDMQSGNTGYVEEFFASRPDWQDKQDETTTQTDNKQQEEKQEAVKA